MVVSSSQTARTIGSVDWVSERVDETNLFLLVSGLGFRYMVYDWGRGGTERDGRPIWVG